MNVPRASSAKLLTASIGIATISGIVLIGSVLGRLDNSTMFGLSHAYGSQPPGKGQPGFKGQPKQGQPGMKGGGFGPTQSSLDSVKTQIKATDEEWKVIGPKLSEVIAARRAAEISTNSEGMGGRFGGPGGFGGGGFGPPGGGPGGFGPPGGGPGGFGPPGGGRGGPPGGGPGGFGPPGGGPGGFGPPGGPGRGPGGEGQGPAAFFLEVMNLTAEQKPQLESLQKEFDSALVKILTDEQNKQLKDVKDGNGGPPGTPPVPQLVSPMLLPASLDRLNLTAEQKTKLEPVQKDFDTKLAKILTEDQNKQLKVLRDSLTRFVPGQPPGFGPGGPLAIGGGPPGFGGNPAGSAGTGDSVTNQALNELQAAIDDPKTTPSQLNEKVAAVRAARKKAREKLDTAQKELLLLLTPEQEAVLVRLGYLD